MSFNQEEQDLYDVFLKTDLLDTEKAYLFIAFCDNVYKRDYNNRKPIIDLCNKLKLSCMKFVENAVKNPSDEEANARVPEVNDIFWSVLRMEAMNKQFDSYCFYLEKNRKPEDKFYIPRRRVLRSHGVPQAFQRLIDDELDLLTISLPPGTGKASRLTSKVLTPTGFKLMKDIHVGDEVIAGNGNKAHVIGVYPQGKRPCYRFTLDDGSSCEVSDEHLWSVKTRDDRKGHKPNRIVKTVDMLKNYRVECGKRCNYSIDYVPKIDFDGVELNLHPYIIGYLIGNGSLSQKAIKVTIPDKCIVDKINQIMPEGYSFEYCSKYDYYLKGHYGRGCRQKSAVKEMLDYYGLHGKRSYEKFIPSEYLYSSYENRLELLRGLMDSDGTPEKSCAMYCTTSKRLAEDVCELVHSLGGYCSINNKTNCGYKDENGNKIKCRDAYNLCIQFSSEQPSPFWLPRKKEIYKPKRKELLRFVKDIEYTGEEECQCIMIDDPCHLYITDDYIITHNTSLEKFFHSAVAGWFPKDYSLFYSHSGDITRMYYDGVYDIISNSDEYTWHEIFPNLRITGTNAKMEQFNVGKYKPFPSVQCTSVGSKNAGKVRASRFLFVDDMIGSLEEALNKATLDKLWGAYTVDARQRKVQSADGTFCKELHIATRWSVLDIIGRLQASYNDNDRVEFIAVPAINVKTGKSNFMYDIGGFTVEQFHDIERLMDDISYRCLYMQDPVEREGLLYDENDLRRFSSLPEREPDAILGICDTKTTGIDYMFLPLFYKFDNDFYLVDCICDDNADFNVQYGRCTDIIVRHNAQQVEFESNAGGSRIAFEVQKRVQEQGSTCSIITHPTETNKETRIIVNAEWIKQNVLFLTHDKYGRKSDYGKMMSFLTSYSIAGRNKHDDVPDGLANFALYVSRKLNRPKTAIIQSPI